MTQTMVQTTGSCQIITNLIKNRAEIFIITSVCYNVFFCIITAHEQVCVHVWETDAPLPLTWSRKTVWWSQRGRKWLQTLARSGRVAGVCWAGPQCGGGVTRMDPAHRSCCCHLASLPVCGAVCGVCSATAMPRDFSFRFKCFSCCTEWIW